MELPYTEYGLNDMAYAILQYTKSSHISSMRRRESILQNELIVFLILYLNRNSYAVVID